MQVSDFVEFRLHCAARVFQIRCE